MSIQYKMNCPISVAEFQSLLQTSTLGERRPIENKPCLEGMLKHANLTITAWDNEKLVGIARSMTDFHYACYLSDLAVDENYQKQGIGKTLLINVQNELADECKLVLISAPAAHDYYEHIGFTQNERCWVLEAHQSLG